MSSTVNTPRYRVTMNGTVLDGVKSLWVTLPFCFQAGQFGIVKAFVPNDAFPVSGGRPRRARRCWLPLSCSTDGVTFQQVIIGNIDSQQYDPIANSICAAGRDLTAPMLDARIVATYRNQTPSQIATAFAAEHGMQTSITASATLVGRNYDADYDEIHSGDFARQPTNGICCAVWAARLG